MSRFNTKHFYAIALLALLAFSFSCGSDDGGGVNCNKIYSQIGAKTDDLLSPDCSVRVAAYTELITLYENGKNCAAIKQQVEDEGYASVDEFLTELEATRDDLEASC